MTTLEGDCLKTVSRKYGCQNIDGLVASQGNSDELLPMMMPSRAMAGRLVPSMQRTWRSMDAVDAGGVFSSSSYPA